MYQTQWKDQSPLKAFLIIANDILFDLEDNSHGNVTFSFKEFIPILLSRAAELTAFRILVFLLQNYELGRKKKSLFAISYIQRFSYLSEVGPGAC